MVLNEIIKPVSKELGEFTKYFKSTLKTDVALLNLIIRYLTRKQGKQVRPAMVFLSAMLCGKLDKRAFVGAALVELLHTATLIHDDVVDEADERRGIASINKQWNNKIAVLIGDFLLSKGLLSAVESDEFMFLKISSRAVKLMSEGELLSIEKSRTLRVSEEDYFKIIKGKTASLLSSCCEIGAFAASDNPEHHIAMRNYGEYVGIAFQIRDDIFDFTSSRFDIGKPVGNDLKEKKITLPLIYALNKIDSSEAKEIIKMIKKGKVKSDKIKEIIKLTIAQGGIEYSQKVAMEYVAKAKQELNIFEDCEAKKSLIDFADYVVERDN